MHFTLHTEIPRSLLRGASITWAREAKEVYHFLIFYEVKNMSKGMDSKKKTKKEPAKTLKEKKAAKKAKKDEKKR